MSKLLMKRVGKIGPGELLAALTDDLHKNLAPLLAKYPHLWHFQWKHCALPSFQLAVPFKNLSQGKSWAGCGAHLVNFPSFRDCTAISSITESSCLTNVFQFYGCLLQRSSIRYTYIAGNGSLVVFLYRDCFRLYELFISRIVFIQFSNKKPL